MGSTTLGSGVVALLLLVVAAGASSSSSSSVDSSSVASSSSSSSSDSDSDSDSSVATSSSYGYVGSNSSASDQRFPAIFIFGDSLTDSGNNNNLFTLLRANRPPYGRDFPAGATGRFCNGPLSTDYIADRLGLPFPPPYFMTRSTDEIVHGATFASAGSGILNSTSVQLGQVFPFTEQVSSFKGAKQKLEQKLGAQAADSLVASSLFYICIGSNDYLVNWFALAPLPSPLQLQYTPSQFVELLQTDLEQRLVELYGMGARKFAVLGLSVLGCVPYELLVHAKRHGECVESINGLMRDYNVALQQRIAKLQASLPGTHFTYLNTYNMLNDIIHNPSTYGFEHTTSACCGSGPYRAVPCGIKRRRKVCADASKYVFWDTVHPSTTFNRLIAKSFVEGSFPDVDPYNLKQLAAVS